MTALPGPVLEGVETALSGLGVPGPISSVTPVAGGCINHGARLDTERGLTFFLKWNAEAPPQLFEAEADGLKALGAPDALRVPRPLARGGGSGAPAWLLMEHLAPGTPGPRYAWVLGRGLARLHRSAPPRASFGWPQDNWIGSLPQANGASSSWAAFWGERRLGPQLRKARDQRLLASATTAALESVMSLLDTALSDVDAGPPHLLHGDLWGGNVFPGPSGDPVLIDPAVYRGHGEVDLAMTELFGGFGEDFYRAYAEEGEIAPEYGAYRRDLYQLYYLLVHVNLFGAQYEPRTVATARRVVAALRG